MSIKNENIFQIIHRAMIFPMRSCFPDLAIENSSYGPWKNSWSISKKNRASSLLKIFGQLCCQSGNNNTYNMFLTPPSFQRAISCTIWPLETQDMPPRSEHSIVVDLISN
jgi:hypothetical protein